jgi:hypothetical protein
VAAPVAVSTLELPKQTELLVAAMVTLGEGLTTIVFVEAVVQLPIAATTVYTVVIVGVTFSVGVVAPVFHV